MEDVFLGFLDCKKFYWQVYMKVVMIYRSFDFIFENKIIIY